MPIMCKKNEEKVVPNFVALRAAVFPLSMKTTPGGGRNIPPPSVRGLTTKHTGLENTITFVSATCSPSDFCRKQQQQQQRKTTDAFERQGMGLEGGAALPATQSSSVGTDDSALGNRWTFTAVVDTEQYIDCRMQSSQPSGAQL